MNWRKRENASPPMAVVDLFSKRKRREEGDPADVYRYDIIPNPLRVQIVQIWGDALGVPSRDYSENNSVRKAYHAIVNILRREYGVFTLSKNTFDPHSVDYAHPELCEFFVSTASCDRAIDVIELSFRMIDRGTRNYQYLFRQQFNEVADAAIEELNIRFNEHGVGYYYSDGTILRVDSEFTHFEITKPALKVLRRPGFESAQAEFLSAHEHYRHGKMSEALVDCCKAFESTIKIISKKRNWETSKCRGASDLVKICFDNNLVPQYWQNHFTGLRSILESGIPTPRNKQAGHGAGTEAPLPVPDELVRYVIHMTAATILFMTEAEIKLK